MRRQKEKAPSYVRMHERFERALVAMETSKPEAHVWRLFEVFTPLPRPADVVLALWAADRAVTAMEEETPGDDRGEQAVEAIREWLWGRTSRREIAKHTLILNTMKYRYTMKPATHQACEAAIYATRSVYSEYCCMETSSAFERSANANVAARSRGLELEDATIRHEEQALQREVTKGFVNAIIQDESALILLDKCRDGDEQTRAIWMDRIAELGLTI